MPVSLMNQLLGGTKGQPEPYEGMPATLLRYSDRDPYTILEVVKFKSGPRAGLARSVLAQANTYVKNPDTPSAMGHQDWIILATTRGPVVEFTRRKDGAFRDAAGNQLRLGYRERYYDWSF